MILQPCSVELTKIHYYDKAKTDRNVAISTISREVCDNNFNRNVIIKKNIFGRKWVLKINENGGEVKKKETHRLVVYILVFCSIVIAVCFGIFFSLDKDLLRTLDHKIIHLHSLNESTKIPHFHRTHENQVFQTPLPTENKSYPQNTTTNNTKSATASYCGRCSPGQEVCLKIQETEKPKCVRILDKNDPTGCGGLCPINTHFCHVLDSAHGVYQCSILKNTLKCPNNTFNCGNRCIPAKKRCDGVVHCSNRADEENCVCNLETHFQCSNSTSCLVKSKKCDQKVDCWDKSDEADCDKALNCKAEEIPCSNGECIPKDRFCDGTFDCTDKTDEPEGCQT